MIITDDGYSLQYEGRNNKITIRLPQTAHNGIDGELQYCNILNAIYEHEWKLEAIIARFSPFNRNIEEEEE